MISQNASSATDKAAGAVNKDKDYSKATDEELMMVTCDKSDLAG